MLGTGIEKKNEYKNVGIAVLCGIISWNISFFVLPMDLGLMSQLSYGISGLFTCYICRKMGLCVGGAISGGIIYSFIPFHYLCNQQMDSLSYFLVPIIIYICYMMIQGEKISCICGCIIMFLSALCSVDFAIFWLLFLISFWIYSIIVKKYQKIRSTLLIIIIVGIVSLGIMYQRPFGLDNGTTGSVYSIYGMKERGLILWSMFLPIVGHRISILSNLSEHVYQSMEIEMVGHMSSIGGILLLGMFITLLALYTGEDENRQKWFGKMNLFCILVGATDGIGMLLGYFSFFRYISFEKIVTVIAFGSVLGLVDLIEKLMNKYRIPKIGTFVIFGLLTILAIWDMTPQSV